MNSLNGLVELKKLEERIESTSNIRNSKSNKKTSIAAKIPANIKKTNKTKLVVPHLFLQGNDAEKLVDSILNFAKK